MKPRCGSAGVFYYRRHSAVIPPSSRACEAIQLMIASFLPRPSRSPLANHQLDCFTGVRNDGPVITNEREANQIMSSSRACEAIQLISASSLLSLTRAPLANPQLDYVAPARNDGLVITNEREANQIMSSSRACEAIQLMLENSLLSSTTLIN
jgi:hypothetical protein